MPQSPTTYTFHFIAQANGLTSLVFTYTPPGQESWSPAHTLWFTVRVR